MNLNPFTQDFSQIQGRDVSAEPFVQELVSRGMALRENGVVVIDAPGIAGMGNSKFAIAGRDTATVQR